MRQVREFITLNKEGSHFAMGAFYVVLRFKRKADYAVNGDTVLSELKAKEYRRFEKIKHIRSNGSEYWLARELAVVLNYTEWRNFIKVIDKAMIACKNSTHNVIYDFVEINKIVDAGATSKPVKDYKLSRYACYLIVQNGDPRKEIIAYGQTYFAIQTYRQEIGKKQPLMLDE